MNSLSLARFTVRRELCSGNPNSRISSSTAVRADVDTNLRRPNNATFGPLLLLSSRVGALDDDDEDWFDETRAEDRKDMMSDVEEEEQLFGRDDDDDEDDDDEAREPPNEPRLQSRVQLQLAGAAC